MNCLGHQTFAGAGLTCNKNGTVTVWNFSNEIEYLPHFLAATNDGIVLAFGIQFCQNQGIFDENIEIIVDEFADGQVLHPVLLADELKNNT